MSAPDGGHPGAPLPGPHRWAGRHRRGVAVGAAVVLLAVIAVIAVTASSSDRAAHALPLAKGFTLPVLGHPGRHVSLAGYAGRPVIVNFFASWCVPCKKETPLLARFYRSEHGQVPIIGVDSNDQAGAAMSFTRAAGVSYPVGFDPSSATASAYGVIAIPQTFFLNARHRIAKRVFGAVTWGNLTGGNRVDQQPPERADAGRLTPAAAVRPRSWRPPSAPPATPARLASDRQLLTAGPPSP